MSLGYLSLVITCALLGSAAGRPRRQSKRILSSHESDTRKVDRPLPPLLARPPLGENRPEDTLKAPESKFTGNRVKGDTRPKVDTRPTHISDKKLGNDGNKPPQEKVEHHRIPPKIPTKGNSEESRLLTESRVRTAESSTSEYYTESTKTRGPTTSPPWHQQYIQDMFASVKGGEGSNYNHVVGEIQVWDLPRAHRTRPSEGATSPTPGYYKCPCHLIDVLFDNLYHELLFKGLYSNEQAKRCLNHCNHRTPSFSSNSPNMPTMNPARQNEISIATESVDPNSLSIVRGRQHCYQTLKSRNVTVNSGDLCHPYYKPTHDSPQPSSKPKGLNVWTCCKTITPRVYY
ncbi:hypothetical protein ACHWQZ_G004747 [Mnemiopsis leidyi]